MKIAMPSSITSAIAFSAARNAKQYAGMRGWASGVSINPIFGPGYAGVRSENKFLMFQELGTRPFLMTRLEGKTVPINGPDGLHFIKVKGVGQPGFVTLPGGVRVWRAEKWKHPGIKPTNFMRNAIQSAMIENRWLIKSLTQTLMGVRGNIQPW